MADDVYAIEQALAILRLSQISLACFTGKIRHEASGVAAGGD